MKTIKIEKALNLNNTIFIDVRTESEYNEDCIKDAFHMPLFKDDEHSEIGTIYKMQGKHEAIQKGFDYVSYKLKDMYVKAMHLASEYENIVIYCARGGMRSGSVVNLLSTLGVNVYQLEGGYKSYRNFVLNYLETIMDEKQFIVAHGLTGVGKTDLLVGLEQQEIDIVDLEGLAKNTGSVFGFITFDEKPPSQKKFETKIFEKIYYSKTNFIFIESESKRVGHVSIPNNIYEAIVRDGYHVLIDCSLENRVTRLCRDYIYDRKDKVEDLKTCIGRFKKRLGKDTVEEYLGLLDEGKYELLVEKYLVDYYDPLYMHSVEKYKYNKIINFDNIDKGINEAIEFHKQAERGEI